MPLIAKKLPPLGVPVVLLGATADEHVIAYRADRGSGAWEWKVNGGQNGYEVSWEFEGYEYWAPLPQRRTYHGRGFNSENAHVAQRKGALVRTAKLTPERRSEIGKKAAAARWARGAS